MTYGSSGCAPTASDVTLQADGSVAVTLEDPVGDVACTADYAPRATLVRIATGRDAADTAFLTVVSGRADLVDVEVSAVADELPGDDLNVPVSIA